MSYIDPHMTEFLKDHIIEELIDPAPIKLPRFKPGKVIQAFRCGRPDSWVYTTVLFFTPYGISISGDLMLGGKESPHGVWCPGYDLEWFTKQRIDEDYLCSKFYRQVWQQEAAIQWCRDHAKRVRSGHEDHDFKALQSASERFDEIVGSLALLERDLKECADSASPETNEEIRHINAEKAELLKEREQIEKDLKGIREQYAAPFEELANDLDNGDVGDVRQFAEELVERGYVLDGYCPGYDYPLAEAGWLCALQKKFSELYQAKYATPATV